MLLAHLIARAYAMLVLLERNQSRPLVSSSRADAATPSLDSGRSETENSGDSPSRA